DDGVRLGNGVTRRIMRVWDRDAAHARRLRRADAVVRVLDRRALVRVDTETACDLDVHVRSRLPRGDLLRRHGRAEAVRDAAGLEHAVDDLAVRRRREPEDEVGREPPYGLDGARQPRRPGLVTLEHALDDQAVDLLRQLGEADAVVHVTRPLRRAHPHHVALRTLVPVTAAFAGQRFPHLVPQRL